MITAGVNIDVPKDGGSESEKKILTIKPVVYSVLRSL